jgi:hypothetical protein
MTTALGIHRGRGTRTGTDFLVQQATGRLDDALFGLHLGEKVEAILVGARRNNGEEEKGQEVTKHGMVGVYNKRMMNKDEEYANGLFVGNISIVERGGSIIRARRAILWHNMM